MESVKKPMRLQKKYIIALLLAGLLVLALVAVPLGYSAWQRGRHPVRYQEQVEKWAGAFGMDPLLVYAIINTESGFDPNAQSGAGAIGLMQMTEDTFDWIKGRIAPDEALVFEDLYTPEVAIRFGACFFSMCLEKYQGDIPTAAAAYHSGWGTVDGLLAEGEYNSREGVLDSFPFRQMRHYVSKINSNYAMYQKLYK